MSALLCVIARLQDVPTLLDFNNLCDPKTMIRCHHVLTCYRTGSQVLLPRRYISLERNNTFAFCGWWSKMFMSSTLSQHTSDSKRKQSNLSDTNILNDEGLYSTRPKLKIVHSRKPLKPFVPSMADDSSLIAITIPVIPSSAISSQHIASSTTVTNDVKEYFKSSPAEICR
ncbi:hypothetical protein Cgig2_015521 [Carnegiea gigantea]|uniref:Uncharacterized protein n=1 Tax=Carnegiea gigantea TaxID=171969 RepID=A0A9Q1JKH6_9CARY|nr:hypothetical protein Cgig2_015521 [Carnegiea gigantea]